MERSTATLRVGKNALPPVNRGAGTDIYRGRGGARGKRTLIERLLVSDIVTPGIGVLLIMLRRGVEDVSQQASPDVAGFSEGIKASSLNYDSRGGRSKRRSRHFNEIPRSTSDSIISR